MTKWLIRIYGKDEIEAAGSNVTFFPDGENVKFAFTKLARGVAILEVDD